MYVVLVDPIFWMRITSRTEKGISTSPSFCFCYLFPYFYESHRGHKRVVNALLYLFNTLVIIFLETCVAKSCATLSSLRGLVVLNVTVSLFLPEFLFKRQRIISNEVLENWIKLFYLSYCIPKCDTTLFVCTLHLQRFRNCWKIVIPFCNYITHRIRSKDSSPKIKYVFFFK